MKLHDRFRAKTLVIFGPENFHKTLLIGEFGVWTERDLCFEKIGVHLLSTFRKWGCTGFDVGREAKGAYRGACGPR